MSTETVDVLIVGAGLSGIGAACHLKRLCPGRSVAIVEARQALGGTWDLFRYPGIRSDSDMYTLGYSFKPWIGEKAIADGPSILAYLQETARENGIDRQIRYGQRVVSAAWSSTEALWTVEIERQAAAEVAAEVSVDTGSAGSTTAAKATPTPSAAIERLTLRCNFLLMCSGYYDYDAGYTPAFAGLGDFAGRIVHPQHWPASLDVNGKRVVVIGSGATAVTLVPELAKQGAQVTMLQRSPTYMVTRPSVDKIARRLLRWGGPRLAHGLTRWKNVLWGMYIFKLCRSQPLRVKTGLIDLLRPQLPAGYDLKTHFTPRYNPWDQRLCLVPDGDFFKAISQGLVSLVTDEIERFTATGIALKSGATLPADLVVTATGLQVKLLAGMTMQIDGQRVDPAKLVSYKGFMFGGVPNYAGISGYTNASWTLKADLVSAFIGRLLNHMESNKVRQCMPQAPDAAMPLKPWVDFSSGYFARVMDTLPKQGSAKPWMLNQNYIKDLMWLRFGKVDDGVMRFTA